MPVQFAHVTGWLAFRSWLSRTFWRWLGWCGCTIITLSLLACHSDPPASAQQNRPREEASSPKETSTPKQVKVARVLDTPLERTTAALGSRSTRQGRASWPDNDRSWRSCRGYSATPDCRARLGLRGGATLSRLGFPDRILWSPFRTASEGECQ